MTAQKNYTSEVLAALGLPDGSPSPAPPPPLPADHVRYFVAVEATEMSGTAPTATVAAHLRALADQLDPATTDTGDWDG